MRLKVARTADRYLAKLGVPLRSWGDLRVLAFHDVSDVGNFGRLLGHLHEHYQVVGLREVLAGRLPERAVWITFDDGDPTVIEKGLPVLRSYEMSATLYICPSVVGTDEPLWFQRALAHMSPAEVSRLKSLSAVDRSKRVAALPPTKVPQVSLDSLSTWVKAGCTLGNHTWSHPLLDQCSAAEVEHEIREGQAWLDREFPDMPRSFAFPNGNVGPDAVEFVRSSGAEIGLLFDHHVAHWPSEHPLTTSRIRVNATDSLDRFAASVSGSHPLLHSVRQRLSRVLKRTP